MSNVESSISQLEKEIAKIDQELHLNYNATIANPNFFDSYEKKKKSLKKYMEEWESLTIKLEELA